MREDMNDSDEDGDKVTVSITLTIGMRDFTDLLEGITKLFSSESPLPTKHTQHSSACFTNRRIMECNTDKDNEVNAIRVNGDCSVDPAPVLSSWTPVVTTDSRLAGIPVNARTPDQVGDRFHTMGTREFASWLDSVDLVNVKAWERRK